MSSQHDPLVLGQPYGSASQSGANTNTNNSTNAIAHVETPSQQSQQPQPSAVPTDTENASTPTRPPLPHLRTAPQATRSTPSLTPDTESSTATLAGHGANPSGIPLAAGGLHGQPLPGSHMTEKQEGHLEKDHQAAGTSGKTGPEIAALAKAELGLNEKDVGDFSQGRNESSDKLGALPIPDVDPSRKVERTASGTHITGHARDASGQETVRGFGMVPVTRQQSLPPAVSPFGGVAPTGPDAEMGLRAVRSHEEEEEREAEMQKTGPDPWSVRFEPGEKINPKNWGVAYRWYLTGVAGLLVLNSTFASSSPSGIVSDMEKEFGFSQEVAVLTISLFVAGYCVGPLLWGPLSESYGRRPLFIGTFLVYTGFQVGCALSKNTASILVFRFLGGTFAAAPLTNSGALIADIWDGDHRGQAMSLFSLAPFAGPSIGPIVAGFIQVSGTDWRWVFWILTIFAGVCLVIIIFTVPETYAPMILVTKAKRLRKETGEERWYAPLEKADTRWKARLSDILLKPFIMLALEPMLLSVTLYMSFVYGVVYLLFEAYPFVFIENHGFNTGEEGLAFLGFFSGGALMVIFYLAIIEPRYQRHAAKMAPAPPKPEKRLELCVISGWCLVVAMFWFGWTSYPSIHWISPVLAGGLIGMGVLGMFVSLFNYIIDVYLWAAASALAGATVARSACGAAFPLFATQMYAKLGTQWASSLLGFLALLMAPIPIVLMKFGPKLRMRSKYSPNKMMQ
ncbi:hypothetical protein EHS25_006005 [Saitozyma podzolica]|uniref:Major facilitator superfamily (MFS) profile domain-containing protein n=1 Tax=Saitozyma podzolica TaxID=1890683 RepID=A0A427XU76_9TREE|nr:hypothetical protein EHS25_006005 [Saitozyma podzolica]